jgi:hypothetical protein
MLEARGLRGDVVILTEGEGWGWGDGDGDGGIHFSILLSPLFRDYAGLMARRRQLQCIPKEGNPAFYKGG